MIKNINWKIEEVHQGIKTPKNENATFELKYKS